MSALFSPRGPRRLARASSIVLTAAVVALVGITTRAQQAPIAITLDAARPGPTLNRHLFGQFAEHLGKGIYEGIWVGPDSSIPNTRGIRNDVVAALKALKVPNVRWPGGCFADEYHWRKGIGPLKDRPVTLNPNWGGVTEPNTFGTHEFLDFVEQIGADPYLSVNVGSGTPAEAADWLEYLTTDQQTALARERAANGHPAPYRIPILGIGNESWDCGGNMSPEYYTSQLRVFSRFVRNFNPKQQGDDRMLKIAVGPGGGEPRFAEWTETVMKSWKGRQWSWDHMDGLSLHNYTVVRFPASYKSVGFGEQEYAEILQDTLKMDRLIREHSAIMDKYDPEKKVALVVDEWGAWYAQLPGTTPGFLAQQNSVRDAIIVALNINTFARYADRVRMANIAQMINVLQAMILTDGPKMVLTPTYHAFRMYVPFQGASVVPMTFDAGRYVKGSISLPRVDAMAAKDASGTLWISLTNVDPNQPAEIDTTVNGLAARSASGEVLTGPAIDSVNTFEAPQAVTPKPIAVRLQGNRLSVTLPPKSLTVVAVRP
ncbi:alpha-L-arabinofuranosidase [Luteitalea sp. TBR-22]|uniref:alpha-N-arabinofuranosidase n=1 Tax=Luteitalea sp. TBR-22 TaxID=2802971 RepID=UPI001AF1D04F|nr:alpha-L-arabinofuranosidase C-terminal domain-containing protein [Luteitalea sp. TBR-22]BCS34938.1 alpha-L-arabinofuranosidase [Luteitalea sp. TBR-22]